MFVSKDIEYVNRLRICVADSEEYALGRRTLLFKQLLMRGRIFSLVKTIFRHIRIAKLTQKTNEYGLIKKQNNAWKNKRIVVYTCIAGDYDNIMEPLPRIKDVDYVLFTDKSVDTENDSKWKVKYLNGFNMNDYSNSKKNRYIKFHPHELFKKEYDYAIYVDGNIQVISDIREFIDCIDSEIGIAMHRHRARNDIYDEYRVCRMIKKGDVKKMRKQVKKYKSDGFPKQYGMVEANVMVIDLHSDVSKRLLDTWWRDFCENDSGRDQIAFPYILWKNNIPVGNVATLGSDVYANSKLVIGRHIDKDRML